MFENSMMFAQKRRWKAAELSFSNSCFFLMEKGEVNINNRNSTSGVTRQKLKKFEKNVKALCSLQKILIILQSETQLSRNIDENIDCLIDCIENTYDL